MDLPQMSIKWLKNLFSILLRQNQLLQDTVDKELFYMSSILGFLFKISHN